MIDSMEVCELTSMEVFSDISMVAKICLACNKSNLSRAHENTSMQAKRFFYEEYIFH